MDAFVLDASMTMAWHFRDEETAQTAAAEQMTIDHTVVVPSHWIAEVGNTLRIGEKRRNVTIAETARFVERLDLLMLVIDEASGLDLMARVLPLARAHDLTVYDALYLELAERRGLPLASLDKALCSAARHVGVPVITDSL